MKQTEILKQEYSLANNFDTEAAFVAFRAQVDSKIFKELIKGEKDSLTIQFRVFVNEQEREDIDSNELALLEFAQ